MAERFRVRACAPHPSGRPLPRENRRSWPMFSGPYEPGFRTPRLNEPHIRSATDIFAVGFLDHRAGAYEVED